MVQRLVRPRVRDEWLNNILVVLVLVFDFFKQTFSCRCPCGGGIDTRYLFCFCCSNICFCSYLKTKTFHETNAETSAALDLFLLLLLLLFNCFAKTGAHHQNNQPNWQQIYESSRYFQSTCFPVEKKF